MQIEVGNTNKDQSKQPNSKHARTLTFAKAFLLVGGIVSIIAISVGVYSFIQNQPSELATSPTTIELPDKLDLDCDITEVLDNTDKSGLYCQKQELNGKINGNDSTKQSVIMANAEKYELEGNEFTQTLEYKIPEELYDISNLDIDTIKKDGIDDELEITLIDSDTGEILANKTIKIHYNVDDDDIDAIIHYNVTISNITIEQIQQIIVQNNSGITEEEIEAIIQRREERIAAGKEAERLKEQEEAQKRAEEARIQSLKSQFVNNQSYSAWLGYLCTDNDNYRIYPVIDDYKYEITVGCIKKNASPTATGRYDESSDLIEMKLLIDNIPSTITPPPFEHPNDCNTVRENVKECWEQREAWDEYYKAKDEEYINAKKRIVSEMALKHSMGVSYPANEDSASFYVPKGANNLTLYVNGYSIKLSVALEWPLTYEQIVPRVSITSIPEELR